MARSPHRNDPITTDVLMRAYAQGIFPMAESADDPGLYWVEPEQRGIFPLDAFHVPSRLARTVKADRYAIRFDHDFEAVVDACAEPAPERGSTWISGRIRSLYRDLFREGRCHTVEVYDGENLVGGLYGVRVGGAFCGESMFHRARDASKIALVHLVARLIRGGFRLLDTQFVTAHLSSLGAVEVSRLRYRALLTAATQEAGDWSGRPMSGREALSAIAAHQAP